MMYELGNGVWFVGRNVERENLSHFQARKQALRTTIAYVYKQRD
jgi:hypothetical protein